MIRQKVNELENGLSKENNYLDLKKQISSRLPINLLTDSEQDLKFLKDFKNKELSRLSMETNETYKDIKRLNDFYFQSPLIEEYVDAIEKIYRGAVKVIESLDCQKIKIFKKQIEDNKKKLTKSILKSNKSW